ncbi:MAG: gliding motility protein GldN [Chitinophagales bacterium]|nr:gliding motility protein GldN [Chitinophagales bacterium]
MKKLKLIQLNFLVLGCLLASAAKSQSTEATPRDLFYDKVTTAEKEAIPYPYINESNVLWQKRVWRVIDAKEKMNFPFRYEGNDWKGMKSLVMILREAAINGEITVYNEDYLQTPETPADVDKFGAGTDTIAMNDLEGNFSRDTVIKKEFDPTRVSKYRVKEDWFIDKQTSQMMVRIEAVAPLYYDDQAQIEIPMFWAYYPDCRSVLAKQEVFNPKNDAVRLSWDDLFEMRYFSSYIIKESNALDRRIQDYTSGVDALRESDRVKQEIIDKEQDMWSY